MRLHVSKKVFNWTKDSRNLIFTSNYNENWEYDFRNSEIYSISVDEKKVSKLTNRFGPDNGSVISNDGNKIEVRSLDLDITESYKTAEKYEFTLEDLI